MLQDTDFFEKLEAWLTLGDVLPGVDWSESPSPDERYNVLVEWRFRGRVVGNAQFVIEPVFDSDHYRLFWIGLRFIEEWQQKGLYTEIVKSLSNPLPSYNVVEVVAAPWDKEAERRLASQGFEWRDNRFVLDLAPKP
jgi:hypothetical protein